MATNPNWSWAQNYAAQPSIPATQPPLGQPYTIPQGPSPPTGNSKSYVTSTYTHQYGTRSKKGGVLPGPTNYTSAVMVDTRRRSRSAPPRITPKTVKATRSKSGSGKRKTRRSRRHR